MTEPKIEFGKWSPGARCPEDGTKSRVEFLGPDRRPHVTCQDGHCWTLREWGERTGKWRLWSTYERRGQSLVKKHPGA